MLSWKVLFVLTWTLTAILAVGVAYLQANISSLFHLSPPRAFRSEPEIFLLSEDPFIIYIKDFTSTHEATHLVTLRECPHMECCLDHFAITTQTSIATSEGRFKPSMLWDDSGKPHRDHACRSSMTAKLPKGNVIERIEARARAFPFYKRVGDFQPMVVQNNGVEGQYRDHFDWYDDAHAVGGNVASTFFVYVLANCTGGGTNFSRLTPPKDEWWCEFINCGRPIEDGTTFLPALGNAVYWENVDFTNGNGQPKALHAGMPVTSGNKMGLNMCTWQDA
jgi:prolyl 4-hydroxylase